MQVTETLSEGLKREYQVVVGADDLDRELNRKLTELAGRAHIKGFRPGKVPVPHLRRVYGKSVMAEVVQEQLDQASKKLLEERNLKPAYRPEVTLPEDKEEVERIFSGKSDLSYKVAFEVIPPFDLADPGELVLERYTAEVTDAHLDETLSRLAANAKSWEPKDGSAAQGDRVTIDFVGKVNGEPFEGGTNEDVPVEIGSGQFLPGFEEQLVGATAGSEQKVSVTFPEDYGAAALAGKPAEFEVKVKSVEAAKETAIDDELAKRLGFEDLGKLKDNVRQRLEHEFANMSRMKLKRDVLDALDKVYTFALPERLVEGEFSGIWNALEAEMKRGNKSFADEGTTEEDARKEYRAIAERRVRLGLVLGTMGEKEGITVSEDELRNGLISRASQFPGRERAILEFYRRRPEALVEIRGPIFEQKVVDHIVSKAKVTDKAVTREELAALVEAEDEHDHVHDHDHDHAGHDHALHDHDHDHAGHDHALHDHDHDHAPRPAEHEKKDL
ncbi:MAG: trigger factor [Hyphomicrobiales bacterium]